MVVTKEGTFDIGGHSLYTKSWLPDGPTKAKLVFFHGFSDHVNRYEAFFTSLADRGIAVHGLDQRGWGRSVRRPAERGLTGTTPQVLADMAAFISSHLPPPGSRGDPSSPATGDPDDVVVPVVPVVPVFVMGHSMGGGQVLTLASDRSYQQPLVRRVRGWLVESPFIAHTPAERPSALKVFAGRLVGRWMPRQQLRHVVPPALLSRDPAVVQSIAADELMHNTGTLEGLAALLDRTAALASGATRPQPGGALRALWVGHGTQDRVTWFEASRKWFEECTGAVADREFKAYEGWYHQLHADGPESEQFYRDVGDWILARSGDEQDGGVGGKAGGSGSGDDAGAGNGGGTDAGADGAGAGAGAGGDGKVDARLRDGDLAPGPRL